MAPTTTSTMPRVQRIGIPATKPISSKMTPRMITKVPPVADAPFYVRELSERVVPPQAGGQPRDLVCV